MAARGKKEKEAVRPKLLCQELDVHSAGLFTAAFKGRNDTEILQNLKFPPREYQLEALGRFDYFRKESFVGKPERTNLLFHMATGSGKTLVIAANILHLFRAGYFDFIFFVNSKNVIEKTRENFMNPASSKYLFAERIEIGGRVVEVAEISSLADSVPGRINLCFTTIQGLHSDLNTPRENSITYHDFEGRKIALLSDETHHLNAITKLRDTKQNLEALGRDDFTGLDLSKLKGDEKESLRSWEGTVMKLFKMNPENILLEYTATIDLEDPNIFNKYRDKIIYQYDLRQYRKDGFSKEIEVLQADLAPLDRALQSVVLSQYRRLLAAKNRIVLKPVVLFKANFVNQPKRVPKGVADVVVLQVFKERFHEMISKLNGEKIEEIRARVLSQSDASRRLKQAFEFFEREGLTNEMLAESIQEEFDESRCLSVNDDGGDDQKLLNSLEDTSNKIRAVFAVEKLNEGWDVLNLFDIVRLYDTRDARHGKPGEKTIREAQLIGRGARYCPFSWGDEAKDKRKFDDDEENELRVLEELFFHSKNNTKYIQELRQAMIFTGISPKETKSLPVTVKESFKKTRLWKEGVIFLNKKVKVDASIINGLTLVISEKKYQAKLFTGSMKESSFLGGVGESPKGKESREDEKKTLVFTEIPREVLRKAADRLSFFRFENLKRFFPNLKSINEFITDSAYLGGLSVEVAGEKERIESLSREDLLSITSGVLVNVREEIEKGWHEHEGTKEFSPIPVREIAKDRILNIVVEEDSDKEFGVPISKTKNLELKIPIGDCDWYIHDENYGTSIEKEFLGFIQTREQHLKERFAEFFLLRNEKTQIFRFSDGRATEPDFILFFRKKEATSFTSMQVFVETKGAHLLEQDQWKEDFLLAIEENAVTTASTGDAREVVLLGLPFYSNDKDRKRKFLVEFQKRFLARDA